MSQLLAELYKLLDIHSIRTSPYHPQTDGNVECFNQTLKSMLGKAVDCEEKYWDKLIPYLLFAYREVPLASTGSSLTRAASWPHSTRTPRLSDLPFGEVKN